MKEQLVSSIQETASHTTYGASAFAVVTGWTFNHWIGAVGVLIAVATFAVNWWYKKETLNVLRNK